MKIGISTNTLPIAGEPKQWDGIGVYTTMLLQGMQGLGHEVVEINHRSPAFFVSAMNLRENQHYFTWPFALSSVTGVYLGLPTPGQRKLKSKIDVYHCTDYHQPVLRHIPIVTTLHDAIFLQNPSWCRSGLRTLKNNMIANLAKQADRIICISETAKVDIIQFFGVDDRKIKVIYHGIDPYWQQPVTLLERQATLDRYQIKPNYLLFTGTISPRKNVYRLLQAYQQLPRELREHWQLVVVGKPGWDQRAIDALQTLNAQGEVRWLGYVDRNELRCLYQGSGLFVFPSLYEGFGLPILEAFASHVPVITANCSALPEVCGEAALLVDPYDTTALADAMESVLMNAPLAETLIKKGQERLQQFSWQDCFLATAAVYQSLL